jgi:hypothetical protein
MWIPEMDACGRHDHRIGNRACGHGKGGYLTSAIRVTVANSSRGRPCGGFAGRGQALRHRFRESVAVVVQRISVPSTVKPRAPPGAQNAPGWTPCAYWSWLVGAGFGGGGTRLVVVWVAGGGGALVVGGATVVRTASGVGDTVFDGEGPGLSEWDGTVDTVPCTGTNRGDGFAVGAGATIAAIALTPQHNTASAVRPAAPRTRIRRIGVSIIQRARRFTVSPAAKGIRTRDARCSPAMTRVCRPQSTRRHRARTSAKQS